MRNWVKTLATGLVTDPRLCHRSEPAESIFSNADKCATARLIGLGWVGIARLVSAEFSVAAVVQKEQCEPVPRERVPLL
jgi:hypothetical protein